MSQDEPVEVKVRKKDVYSFTIEGVNDQIEKLLKEQKIIRTLALKGNGNLVRISRVVRLKTRRDFYFTPKVEIPAIENTHIIRVRCLSMKDLTDLR